MIRVIKQQEHVPKANMERKIPYIPQINMINIKNLRYSWVIDFRASEHITIHKIG